LAQTRGDSARSRAHVCDTFPKLTPVAR
jgi:hypothetical protein